MSALSGSSQDPFPVAVCRVSAVERHGGLGTAALEAHAPSHVVHGDLPHGDGGDGQEVAAVVPVGARLIDQPEISLVDQPAGVERIVPGAPAQLDAGDPPQVLVEQRHQLVDGVRVAGAVRLEELGDVGQGAPHEIHATCDQGCTSHFAPALERVAVAPIRLEWDGPWAPGR
jgi:hypothetical protein